VSRVCSNVVLSHTTGVFLWVLRFSSLTNNPEDKQRTFLFTFLLSFIIIF